MARAVKDCHVCQAENHSRRLLCVECGADISEIKGASEHTSILTYGFKKAFHRELDEIKSKRLKK